MARKKKLKYGIKRLPKDTYVMVRGKSGYVSKTNSRQKYIIEVRHRKTKKLIGYINRLDKKKKAPALQVFTNRKNFLKAKKKRRLAVKDHYRIQLNNKNFMIDQVQRKGSAAVAAIMSRAKKDGSVDVYGDLVFEENVLRSEIKRFTGQSSRSEIVEWLALTCVVNQVRNIGHRMSPKKYARSEAEAQKNNVSKAVLDVYLTNL